MRVRLSALLSAAVLAAASFGAPAHAAAEDAFKVGLIAPLSGPFAALGDSIDRGARLYEKVHGKEVPSVQVIRRDDAGVPDNTRPVSYTHLRAHETRHDLVCRLLLEKK